MDGKNKRFFGFVGEWIAPVAIALVFVLGLAGIFEFIDDSEKPRKPRLAHKRVTSAKQIERPVPRFVVAIPRSGTEVVVRDARTGAEVGSSTLAGQRFQQVAAVGDGTYVVAGHRGGRVTFDRLRLGAKGKPAQLVPLAGTELSGASTRRSDLAVNGDRIAYVSYRGERPQIQVVSIATGARQTWSGRVPGTVTSLAWTGTRLSFVWNARSAGKRQLRLLDPIGPGGDLGGSKALLQLPGGASAAVLSRDGKTVLTGVTESGGVTVAKFSAVTRERTGVMWQRRTDGEVQLTRLKSDLTGTHLLATTDKGQIFSDPAHDLSGQPTGDLDIAWW